jgi:hypothetical protein
MFPRLAVRLALLVMIGAFTALSVGCDATVGVGIGVGYPYAPYGPYGPWAPTVWVGGPVIR